MIVFRILWKFCIIGFSFPDYLSIINSQMQRDGNSQSPAFYLMEIRVFLSHNDNIKWKYLFF